MKVRFCDKEGFLGISFGYTPLYLCFKFIFNLPGDNKGKNRLKDKNLDVD